MGNESGSKVWWEPGNPGQPRSLREMDGLQPMSLRGRGVVFLLALAALLFSVSPSYAVSFGEVELKSHLNERLEANIPLQLSNAELDDEELHIEFASSALYRQLGLTWQRQLKSVRVTVIGRNSPMPYLKLESDAVISAPLLTILLKASSGRGSFFKPFNLFLDPHLKEGVSWAKQDYYGPVKAGEALDDIAVELRKDHRFTIEQIVGALHAKNPGSFTDGDINKLKAGSWLRVPADGSVIRLAAASNEGRQQLLAAKVENSSAVKVNETAVASEMLPAAPETPGLATPGNDSTFLSEDSLLPENEEELLQPEALPIDETAGGWWGYLLSAIVVAILLAGLYYLRMHSMVARVQQREAIKPQEKPQRFKAVRLRSQPQKGQQKPASDDLFCLEKEIKAEFERGNYDHAEKLITVLEEKQPDSLILAVMKTQLYHETGRFEQRDRLINSISESSSKGHWERFCKMLPNHVWNSCFGGDV